MKVKKLQLQPGKLYKLNKVEGLEWIFIWDRPYGGNRAIGRLLVDEPYMFLGHEPGMSVWCNVLYGDRTGWVHLREHSISELTDNESR